MTDRERVLAAIAGQLPDRFPFVPRLEFWYRGRKRAGTLPRELESLSLMEIADKLGVGYYATAPDFTEGDVLDRPLGIDRTPVIPYRVEMQGVERRVLSTGPETVVEYITPVGTVRTATVFTEEMAAAGASNAWVTQPAIRGPADFAPAGYIFSHLKVQPCFDGYLAARAAMADRGVVVAYASGAACPIQFIMKGLMTTEQFFYALNDYPAQIEKLAEQIEPFYAQIKAACAESPAEVVFLGGNYDDSITHPGFFRRYLLPPLQHYADELHQRGKYLLTHTDGENRLLLPLYVEAGFDVADSVCPQPMTRCSLEQLRQGFGDRITIWGGIPSVLLCPESASEEEFRKFIDDLVDRYAHHTRFILGVSDMVTADADFDRLRYIADKVSSIV
jgi:hypothetical protein